MTDPDGDEHAPRGRELRHQSVRDRGRGGADVDRGVGSWRQHVLCKSGVPFGGQPVVSALARPTEKRMVYAPARPSPRTMSIPCAVPSCTPSLARFARDMSVRPRMWSMPMTVAPGARRCSTAVTASRRASAPSLPPLLFRAEPCHGATHDTPTRCPRRESPRPYLPAR